MKVFFGMNIELVREVYTALTKDSLAISFQLSM